MYPYRTNSLLQICELFCYLFTLEEKERKGAPLMKKALHIIKTIFTWSLVVVAVLMMVFTIVSVNTFDRNDRSIFGYKAYIVLSDSMSSVKGDTSKGYFNAGDLILVKEIDPTTLKAGDIISYQSLNPENYGETVTHMIRRPTTDDNGSAGFITYGTNTGADDPGVVTYSFVLGKYQTRLPGVGKFFQFLKTTPGYIICLLIPCLLLILVQGINSIRLFKKYKKEQLAELEAEREAERAEMEAERAAMAEERKRQEEMMQKLIEMQIALQGGVPSSDQPAEETTPSAN